MRELNALNAETCRHAERTDPRREERFARAHRRRHFAQTEHTARQWQACARLLDELAETRKQLASGKITLGGLLAHLTTFDDAAHIAHESVESALRLVSDFRSVIVDYEFDTPETVDATATLSSAIIEDVRLTNPKARLQVDLAIADDLAITTYGTAWPRAGRTRQERADPRCQQRRRRSACASPPSNVTAKPSSPSKTTASLPEKDGSHVFDGTATASARLMASGW